VTYGSDNNKNLISTGQILNTYTYSANTGWKISEMDLIFDAPQPNYPCEN
jgi:hypothetical protein